jgi:hypothetical protein
MNAHKVYVKRIKPRKGVSKVERMKNYAKGIERPWDEKEFSDPYESD